MLREIYTDPHKVCLACRFYFREMKRWLVPNVIKAYELDADSFQTGQKACIKNKTFTYFNDVCPRFTKIERVK